MNGEAMIRADVINAVREAFCTPCFAPVNEWRSKFAIARVIVTLWGQP